MAVQGAGCSVPGPWGCRFCRRLSWPCSCQASLMILPLNTLGREGGRPGRCVPCLAVMAPGDSSPPEGFSFATVDNLSLSLKRISQKTPVQSKNRPQKTKHIRVIGQDQAQVRRASRSAPVVFLCVRGCLPSPITCLFPNQARRKPLLLFWQLTRETFLLPFPPFGAMDSNGIGNACISRLLLAHISFLWLPLGILGSSARVNFCLFSCMSRVAQEHQCVPWLAPLLPQKAGSGGAAVLLLLTGFGLLHLPFCLLFCDPLGAPPGLAPFRSDFWRV